MKLNEDNTPEREFDWEVNTWSLDPAIDIGYNLWLMDEILHLSNNMDLVESIEIKTGEQLKELIDRLITAGKDVFG